MLTWYIGLVPLLTAIVAVLSLVVASIVAWKALQEYRLKVTQQRMEWLIAFRTRLKSDPTFRKVHGLLEAEAESDARGDLNWTYEERRDFAGFTEELELAIRAGLVDNDAGMRLFGYYVRLMFKSERFWFNMDPTHTCWSTLHEMSQRLSLPWPARDHAP